MSRDDRIELTVMYRTETDSAYLVFETEDEGEGEFNEVWLPKSQTDVVSGTCLPGKVITVDIPEWLACAKGLI